MTTSETYEFTKTRTFQCIQNYCWFLLIKHC